MREMVTVNGLLQFEQHIGPPVPLQTPRHLFPACLDPVVRQIRQFVRVPLALENGGDDRLPADSADIADHVGQLNVHFGQRLLHVLHLSSGLLDVPVPQSPDRAHVFHVLLQPERIAHQSVSVQLHQPLAFLHVGLSAGHILGVLRVHQHHPDAMLFQNVVQRDPVHAGGLHRHSIDPARLQPFRHLVQGCRPAAKFPHRIRIPIRRHGHKVALITHVDPSGVGVNDRQTGIARRHPPPQLSALRTVHLAQCSTARKWTSCALPCHTPQV